MKTAAHAVSTCPLETSLCNSCPCHVLSGMLMPLSIAHTLVSRMPVNFHPAVLATVSQPSTLDSNAHYNMVMLATVCHGMVSHVCSCHHLQHMEYYNTCTTLIAMFAQLCLQLSFSHQGLAEHSVACSLHPACLQCTSEDLQCLQQ